MMDEFVEIMYVLYESELDMSVYTSYGSMIEYRMFKPGSKFEEYISLFAFISNQTKGLYADYTFSNGEVQNNINLYQVPDTLKEWNSLNNEQ